MRQHSDRAFNDTLELFKTAFTLEEEVPEGYDTKILDTDAFPSTNPKMRISCTGQLRRHLTKQVGIVDSERTKIVYGTLTNAAGPDLAINDMEIHAATDFGVIALSSLTDDAITDSENMLLSAIGKVRNTGQICDGKHLAKLGTTPIVAELIQADIRIKNRFGERIVVWGINAEGTYVQKMPTTCEDGWIRFTIGDPMAPACYYLIFKE